MAQRRGIDLDVEHARRVAEGEITLAALAAELGCSRQSLFTAFRRRNWPTKAEHQAEKPKIDARATRSAVEGQRLAQASTQPPAPNRPPAASAAPPGAIPWTTAAELAEFARQQVAGVALLALQQLADQLSCQRLGPGAIKAGVQAAQGAAELLHRAGIMIDQEGAQEAPRMLFIEMTADEIAMVQEQAEREFRGEIDDDLAEFDQSDNQQSISI